MPLTSSQPTVGEPLTPCKRRRMRWELLDAARLRLGIQKKEIAHAWDCSHVYVSRVLGGLDPLPDVRVHQLPEELQTAMVEEEGADLGVLVGSKAVAIGCLRAALVLLERDERPAKLRMATATLDEPENVETRRRA